MSDSTNTPVASSNETDELRDCILYKMSGDGTLNFLVNVVSYDTTTEGLYKIETEYSGNTGIDIPKVTPNSDIINAFYINTSLGVDWIINNVVTETTKNKKNLQQPQAKQWCYVFATQQKSTQPLEIFLLNQNTK